MRPSAPERPGQPAIQSYANARRILDETKRLYGEHPLDVTTARRIILILSPSRGGSSLLYQILASRPDVLSIAGEHTFLYKLNGMQRGPAGSEVLDDASPAHLESFRADLADWIGVGLEPPAAPDVWEASLEEGVIRRLTVQWPFSGITLDEIQHAVKRALESGRRAVESTFVDVLRDLRQEHPEISLRYYDGFGGGPERATAPPPHPVSVLEEPPFVFPTARRRPSLRELQEYPLVLKASVDVYRTGLLRRLFPEADFKVIHLSRNPAASINGLYDGWRDRGFYSYSLEAEGASLDIRGYSELGPHSQQWWNFDLPPNWASLTAAPLEAVCAAQWSQAQLAILGSLSDSDFSHVLRVRFEDLVDQSLRNHTLHRIQHFCGLPESEAGTAFPTVMASLLPRPGRWRQRQELIDPYLANDQVHELCRVLGYPLQNRESWT